MRDQCQNSKTCPHSLFNTGIKDTSAIVRFTEDKNPVSTVGGACALNEKEVRRDRGRGGVKGRGQRRGEGRGRGRGERGKGEGRWKVGGRGDGRGRREGWKGTGNGGRGNKGWGV